MHSCSERYRSGLLRFHDAAAWLSQVTMFVLLGLLVFPSKLVDVAWVGLALGLFLAFVARPLVVALCLLPFRFPRTEALFISWVGLRGAVPIVLAIMPVLAGVPGGDQLFHVEFFVVVVSAILPGGTVAALARRLGLARREPSIPQAVLEITSTQPLEGGLLSFTLSSAAAVAGASIGELPLPEGSSVMLVIRGRELVPPRGKTVLLPEDHIYVFGRRRDRPFVELLFGSPDEA